MTEFFRKETLPGIFVITAIFLITFIIFSINPPNLVSQSYGLKVQFDSIAGLREDAAVWFAGVEKYQGIDIGKVKTIRIINVSDNDGKQQYKIEVALNINKAVPIKEGAAFRIATKGLAGNPHVEIIPGLPDAKEISRDKVIQGINPPPDMFTTVQELSDQVKAVKLNEIGPKLNKAMDNIVVITTNLSEASKNIDEIVKNVKEKKDVENIISNVKTISEKGIATIDKAKTTLDKSEVFVTNLNSTLGKVDGMVTENRDNIKQMITNFTKLSASLDNDLTDTITKLNALIANMDNFLKENKEQINDIMINLKATTQNTKLFTQDIKLNPWKLFIKNKEKKPSELELKPDKGPVIR